MEMYFPKKTACDRRSIMAPCAEIDLPSLRPAPPADIRKLTPNMPLATIKSIINEDTMIIDDDNFSANILLYGTVTPSKMYGNVKPYDLSHGSAGESPKIIPRKRQIAVRMRSIKDKRYIKSNFLRLMKKFKIKASVVATNIGSWTERL